MTETVTIQMITGVSPTYHDVTSIRFCTRDDYNPGVNDPCKVPTSSYYYSYWVTLCLYLTGTFTDISNVQFSTSGNIKTAWGPDVVMLIGIRDSDDNGCPIGSYQQAAGTQGLTGYYIKDGTNGHAYYKSQTASPADCDNYPTGNKLLLDSTHYSASGSRTKCAVIQTRHGQNAVHGDKSIEYLVFSYDVV